MTEISATISQDDLTGTIIHEELTGIVTYADIANPITLVKSTDCKIWLDGKDTSQFSLNGTKVIQWDWKGSLPGYVFNAIDAQRPTYDINTGRVTFTAANSTFLQSAAFGSALSQPNTVFIVYKVYNVTLNDYVFDGRGTTQRYGKSGNNFFINGGPGGSLYGGLENENDNIHVGLFNGTSSEYWINGILKESGTLGTRTLDGITLGAIAGLGTYGSPEIMEVIVYNASITEAERIAVTTYLKNKHKLTY